jgi:hypothetical protein
MERELLDNIKIQEEYYRKRAAQFGLHFFRKSSGFYHATEVKEANYPQGLYLSFTDSKISFGQRAFLENGATIYAGMPLPSGVRMVELDDKYRIELPGGRQVHTLGRPLFHGGQLVRPGRTILTAPSIDHEGQICIDTYSISAAEVSRYYHPAGENRLAVNTEIQTPREMVPLDPEHPIILQSYDGVRMTHEGPAWMVRIPEGAVPSVPQGGFYICADKDLMRIFDGVNAAARNAKRKWLKDIELAKQSAGTKEAKTVRYERSDVEVSTPLVRYLAVMPRQREVLSRPLSWVNVYGVRDGNFSIDIQLPGDTKMFEMPPKEKEWYCIDKEFFDANYVASASGQCFKKTIVLAQELDADGVAVWRYSGNKGDFLVTPVNRQGVLDKAGRYIVERRDFLALYLDEATANQDIAEGLPLTSLAARGVV